MKQDTRSLFRHLKTELEKENGWEEFKASTERMTARR